MLRRKGSRRRSSGGRDHSDSATIIGACCWRGTAAMYWWIICPGRFQSSNCLGCPCRCTPIGLMARPEFDERQPEKAHEEEEILQTKLEPGASVVPCSRQPEEQPVRAMTKAASSPPEPERKPEAHGQSAGRLSRMVQRRHSALFRSEVIQHG